MTHLQQKAINFDKFQGWYRSQYKINCDLKSIDALFIPNKDTLLFIEFKSGNVDSTDIRRKIYDSVIIYLDYKNEMLSDFRNKFEFILVCNQDTREDLGNSFDERAKDRQHFKSNFKDFEGFFFKRVEIMNPKQFEQKINTL